MNEKVQNHYDLADVLARLRDEVIAVVAEGLWHGDSNNGQPDYDLIATLYDDAASNVFSPGVTSDE